MTAEPAAILPPRRCTPGTSAAQTFLAAVVRNPQRIGAIAPSSVRLAAVLASVVPTSGAPVIIELGAGTGAVSAAVAARLPAGARHLAVELDPGMAAYLRTRQPDAEVITGDAHDLSELLAARGVANAAAVIGGLPWSLFDSASRRRILQQIAQTIGAEGVFTTFAYAHTTQMRGARDFRQLLEQLFGEVHTSRIVWRNLPPAFTYICRSPQVANP